MDLLEIRQRVESLEQEGDEIKAKADQANREITPDEADRLMTIAEQITELRDMEAEKERKRAALEALENAKKTPEQPEKRKRAATEWTREALLDDPGRGFKCLGEFADQVWRAADAPGLMDRRLAIGAAASGLSQGVAAEGGFAVPPTYARMIWDGLNDGVTNLVQYCDQYTVEGDSLTMSANAETSRANGSRYGGVRGYWIAEADTITSSKPKLRQVKLEPQELAVLVYMTNKLLRHDLMSFDRFVMNAAQEEIAFMVNDALINGNGVGRPLGVLNASGTVSQAKETGQAATTINATNIDKMWSRLHPRAKAGAIWFVHSDTHPQLAGLNRSVGTGGDLVYNPPGGISQAPYATLKGRPVIEIENCATLGTVGDIILADFGFYALGTRGGVEAASSIHLKFDSAQTAFRFMFEVDGQPWLASALTPFKGSNTLAPFVTLASRS